ncbi:MAG: MG2 domain-containing protein, partial [Saprospiraceae bacterium]|nr:MG2 domain-containing protein [Saprospiraceae bacterium]
SRLIKPDDVFYLQNPASLSSLETFINIDFSRADSSSFVRKALLLFQEVLTFHHLDKDPTILIDFDRQRLLFVRRNLIYTEKDVLLQRELEHLIKKFPAQATTAETYYLLANEKYKQKLINESVALCEQAIKKFPKTFGAFKCNELLQSIRVKNLSLTLEDNGLPNQPILLKVTFQNIQSFKGGIVPVSFSSFQQSKLLYKEEDIQLFLRDRKPEKEALIILPKSTDYQQHVTEIALEGLPVGHYLYVFKSDETKYSFLPFQISNIGYFVNNEGFEKVVFQFFDKNSTEPKGGTSVLAIPVRTGYFSPNAPVITFKETWKESDDQGFLSYSLPQGAFNFKIANGEDTLLIEENFYIGEKYREEISMVLKSNIFSDRKIYRPGQTIFWKAILMERNGIEKPKISANKEVTISFFDPNGSLLVQNTLLSNEMGSINGRFDIPLNLVKGNYTLVSSHGGNRESIQVEEYKRPQFEINFEKAPVGMLGDSLEVKGNAAFFNGTLIENALVKWEIYRKSFPDNWRSMRRFYTRDPGSFLSSGEGITNENGSFIIPFFAKPDISIGQDKRPAFQFEVKVTVTSPSGEIQQKTLTFNIGYSKVKLDVQIPENWDKQKG